MSLGVAYFLLSLVVFGFLLTIKRSKLSASCSSRASSQWPSMLILSAVLCPPHPSPSLIHKIDTGQKKDRTVRVSEMT